MARLKKQEGAFKSKFLENVVATKVKEKNLIDPMEVLKKNDMTIDYANQLMTLVEEN